MRILITGIRGLVGHHTWSVLQAQQTGHLLGTGLRAISDTAPYPYYSADLRSAEAVDALIRWARPDVVLHLAAMTLVDACQENPTLCWEHNVQAVRNLLASLTDRNPRAHFIFVSTDFVYDGFIAEGCLYQETDPVAPISVYGASKLAAEWLVRGYSGPWAIARTSLIYGEAPYLTRDNIYLRIRSQLASGRDLSLFIDQIRTPTWAYDLAQGLYLILKHGAEGVFHLAGPSIETPFSFGQKIAQAYNWSSETIRPLTGEEFRQIAPRPLRSPLSIEKAQRLLGYSPHDTHAALQKLRQN